MYLNAVLPISTFFFMNITVKTVHICRFTDRYYLWNDRFSVLSQKFCPFKGFLDLKNKITRLHSECQHVHAHGDCKQLSNVWDYEPDCLRGTRGIHSLTGEPLTALTYLRFCQSLVQMTVEKIKIFHKMVD